MIAWHGGVGQVGHKEDDLKEQDDDGVLEGNDMSDSTRYVGHDGAEQVGLWMGDQTELDADGMV